MKPVRKALLLDAFYQVLDNKIFRLLLFVVFGIVALSFLFGFQDDRIVMFFGLQELTYESLFSYMGASAEQAQQAGDVQSTAIQGLQKLIIGPLGGVLGITFCIAATAFFVPRMLEKGSADILFSKPVSRLKLLLSRYFAGLLFVGILAVMLTFGIYFGLLVSSGYNDPGFLWSAPNLIYLYGLIHAVSCLIGVVTRSTVASILISMMFFMGTGCVHSIWRTREFLNKSEVTELLREMEMEEVAESLEDEEEEDPSLFLRLFVFTLEGLHYTLPKTKDPEFISRKLMKTLSGDTTELRDEGGSLIVQRAPEGLKRESSRDKKIDLLKETVTWSSEDARIWISRRDRMVPGKNSSKPKRQRLSVTSRELQDKIQAESVPAGEISETRRPVDGISAIELQWQDADSGHERRAVLFAYDVWIYQADFDFDPDRLDKTQREELYQGFVAEFGLDRELENYDPDKWYEKVFDWDAELKFNIFFSLGSSILFAALMLGIGWWRLNRIDF